MWTLIECQLNVSNVNVIVRDSKSWYLSIVQEQAKRDAVGQSWTMRTVPNSIICEGDLKGRSRSSSLVCCSIKCKLCMVFNKYAEIFNSFFSDWQIISWNRIIKNDVIASLNMKYQKNYIPFLCVLYFLCQKNSKYISKKTYKKYIKRKKPRIWYAKSRFFDQNSKTWKFHRILLKVLKKN